MGKAKFVLAVIAACLIGIAGYASVNDECSYSPYGRYNPRLAIDGVRHFIDEAFHCDPWRVIESDPAIESVTIIPSSSWSLAPARPVAIHRDGRITISEPLDKGGNSTREVTTVERSELAEKLLASLSKFTKFNRLTTENLDEYVRNLPKNADLADAATYTVPPEMPCTGRLYDGGSVSLEFVDADGLKRTTILDSFCHSISKEAAIEVAWQARREAYAAAKFSGDHYVEELAGF